MPDKPKVHLYTTCWDEADMLGFFFRHYDPWVDRYVVYDDGSTDGSLDILKAHPKVELRRFERVKSDSFVLSHKAMHNSAWKESRGRADWVVITAIDEHLWVRGMEMSAYLVDQRKQGTTMIPALGFDMNSRTMPHDAGLLIDHVAKGQPKRTFNKLGIFDPSAMRHTGFLAGRHAARSVGDLRLPVRDELMLWHFKYLGIERTAERQRAQAPRLGTEDVKKGLGHKYSWSDDELRSYWTAMEGKSIDLTASGFDLQRDSAGPRWWADRPNVRRVDEPAQPKWRNSLLSLLIRGRTILASGQ